MKDNLYRFSYNYEEVYDVYSVRRIDGNDKIDYVPTALLACIIEEEKNRTGNNTLNPNLLRCTYYDKKNSLAIIDLYGRNFKEEEIEIMSFGINKSIEYHKTMMLSL